MRVLSSTVVAVALCLLPAAAGARQPAASQSGFTDVYNVLFIKAAPGQAAALAKALQEVDPKDPMGSHFLLLRHQEGADWDYCLIQHRGTSATVEITPPASGSPTALAAWHDDTFVAGPSWADFQREMGMSGNPSGSPVYIVGVQRAVPGHRDQLLSALNQPTTGSKVTSTGVTMAHLEGGPWQFLTISRYDSWQDLAADRAAAGGASTGWLDLREHSAYHIDTIADRVR